ncbi:MULTISPECIES: ribosomal protection-like ABC-F family protein [Fusobacterium]|uniref:ribosomal protection-like ABC-F family protein n=1 Tax=Fusobacterium TaxID=848 RepID=UPI001476F627|nr:MULTISPECIES: ABC-F family ATP-binding cassette domain-containing protein [Fusobacterium]NME36845.1 ATP-binding cassette domain-containing protein [Fusobacterium sp. FSA-380-WT-3A]
MALLHVENLYKGFSGETLFKNITFSIDEKDKIGVIGINGAGKTTLIKMLLEEEENDVDPTTNQRGIISKKGNLKIGYLSQNINLNPNNTIFDELMLVFGKVMEDHKKIQELSLRINIEPENFDNIMEELAVVTTRYEQEEGYAIEYKVKQVLNGLSISEDLWQQRIGDLSGGQKSRTALGKILLEEPELLILDEPTNHLDLLAIEWLEKFLKDYNKAVMVVSHDRYFLDNVVGRIFEIEGHTLKTYKGNFTEYTIQKEIYLSGAIKAFEKEQEKIKQMEEYIRRYKAGIKSKQARGRESLLNRMEKMENPVVNVRKMKLKFDIERPSVDRVLKIEKLSKSYDGKKIFQNLNLEIFRGERVGLIGKNGVGKSTLLKIVNGMEKADSGKITIGDKVTIGYYDQNHQGLDEKVSILNEFMFNYPMSEEDVRRLAGGFLFPEEDVFKIIGSLSGGEKARVTLMKLILKKANFLVLDEPTNHLDIYSREVLEEALEDYQGTILIVSHDRYFLEGIVNTIYEITEDGVEKFNGNYSEYCTKKSKKLLEKSNENVVNNYEEQKKIKNRISSLEKKYVETEKNIEKLEEKKSNLEKEYEIAGKKNILEELLEIQEKLENIDLEILSEMEKWEEIEKELKNLKKAL